MFRFSYKNTVWAASTLLLAVSTQNSAHAAPVTAKQANDFVESCGININSRRSQMSDAVYNQLINSGFRTVRMGGGTTASDSVSLLQDLGGRGIKSIVCMDGTYGLRPNDDFWSKNDATYPGRNIVDYIRLVGRNNFRAIEMHNELDMDFSYNSQRWRKDDKVTLSNDPANANYWGKFAQAATKATFEALNAPGAADADLPLIGPSFAGTGNNRPAGSPPYWAYERVGDLGAYLDYSNSHHYMAGREPETNGWGGYYPIGSNIRYASIAYEEQWQGGLQAPGKPNVATEGGNSTYNPTVEDGQWSLTAQGRYAPRYFLAHFKRGWKWTCLYRLENTNSTQPVQRNFGLLNLDGTPKPAFTSVKNLLTLLDDPGANFSPASLDYTLSDQTANVESLLLQKRDGKFYLCLWLKKSSWDQGNNVDIAVAAQNVDIAFASPVAGVSKYVWDDNGNRSGPTSIAMTGSSISDLSVTDRVTVLEINPFSKRIDFNGGTNPTQSGFVGFPLAVFDATRGYGWDSMQSMVSRERTSGSNLFRDAHLGSVPRQFRMNLPNGTYNVRVYLGDAQYARDNMDVYAEGVLKADNVSTAAGQMATRDFSVTVGDGQLTLEYRDDGGTDIWWAANGVEVSAGALSGVSPQAVQASPTTKSPSGSTF